MYDIADDLYCYPNSTVLKNIPGLRSQRVLKIYEIAMTTLRAEEPLPAGRLPANSLFTGARRVGP
jgi:cell filamentation protein